MNRIAIIGAGISGLSLGWFLQKYAPGAVEISIFDAQERVGGWLHTVERDGQLFECGPRSLRTRGSGRAILDLIEDLGIGEEVITASQASKSKYLVHKGQLAPVPSSLYSLITSSFGRMALKACLKDVFSKKGPSEDESVASFFERRFGSSILSRCIDPLVAGIYGADPSSLSIQSCFRDIYEKEQAYGSVVLGSLFTPRQKGPCPMISFKEGIGYLPRMLAKKLSARVHLGSSIDAIREEGEKVVLHTGEQRHTFDALFCAISPHALSRLLPIDLLQATPMTSFVTVTVGWYESHPIPDAFGFLCPSSEDNKLLGVVFDSSVFPQHNMRYKTRASFMFGGQRASAISCFTDADMLSLAKEAAIKYIGIKAPFDDAVIFRANQAVARYPVGHTENVRRIEKQLGRRIKLVGTGFYGVSVGDAIASAKRQAIDFLRLQKK